MNPGQKTHFILGLCVLLALSACGGGGDGKNSPDLSGNWRGTLNLKPADSTPGCPFTIGGPSIFRDLEIEPDTNASFFSDSEPSQILVFGLDDDSPLVGHAGYAGDPEHPEIDVDFDIIERNASEAVRGETSCAELVETVFTRIPDWRPADNAMILTRNFVDTCFLASGQAIQCTFAYEGFFSRR